MRRATKSTTSRRSSRGMGIRAGNNKKDHLRQPDGSPALALVVDLASTASGEDPLRFETSHPDKPCFVDLTEFELGNQQTLKKGARLGGSFTGRPLLIYELAPALRDQMNPLAEKSVEQYLVALRTWWRLFDALESKEFARPRLESTVQLDELHRQCALDKSMRRTEFSSFLLIANTTRAALGFKPLHWQRPEERAVNRHLPPTWQTDLVRRTLKHRWFATLDRWDLAAQLRSQDASLDQQMPPVTDPEHLRLLRNYNRFDAVAKATGHPRPGLDALLMGIPKTMFYRGGFSVVDMLRGRYPDGYDIRAAFHLCLATTGWNAAVLLSLDVSEPFIELHPKDRSRYILRGRKARAGGAEQVTEGLFKTQGSAGAVLQTLIARTAPLRDQLHRELQAARARLAELGGQLSESEEQKPLRRRIMSLEQATRSPWLFASQVAFGIQWLDDFNFSKSFEKHTSSYIGDLVANLNKHQPDDRQLSPLTASDLRDAYAVNAYHASGGSILHVMKALGHRSPRTTQRYLHNTLLKEEHRKLFGTFSTALWQEMASNGRVDPTILAKLSRDGEATREQRERLGGYRSIMLSRIGVGCKDPLNPPRHIAPDFIPDGKAMCHVQRCTLCVEHAIIFPESLPGLCKRLAELRHLRPQMSVGAFQSSSFLEEMDNTEIALQAFNAAEVARNVSQWADRIAKGLHRVMEFDGREQKATQ